MVLKTGFLWSFVQAKMGDALDNLPFDAKEKWNLIKFINQAEKEHDTLEKVRSELIRKYGTEQEDGNYRVTAENNDAFYSELNLLLNQDVEIHTVSLPLSKLAPLSISQIRQLSLLVDEEN